MKMRRLLAVILPLAAVALVAVVVAGCGGSSSGTASGGSASATSSGGSAYGNAKPAPKPATGTVSTRATKLGRILVDANGRTLYLFEKDKGAASSCNGACASIWPPLTAGTAKAGSGVTAADLGTTKRGDGKTEITYAGHPLYTYAGDQKPGDVAGQGLDQFGAEWYVLAPNGHKIDKG
jgi:predicted lipoprotein with Yx(FWY)xxD motif